MSTEIIAEEIDFVGGKETDTEKKAATPYIPTAYTARKTDFEEVDNGDEGLPF